MHLVFFKTVSDFTPARTFGPPSSTSPSVASRAGQTTGAPDKTPAGERQLPQLRRRRRPARQKKKAARWGWAWPQGGLQMCWIQKQGKLKFLFREGANLGLKTLGWVEKFRSEWIRSQFRPFAKKYFLICKSHLATFWVFKCITYRTFHPVYCTRVCAKDLSVLIN